jgi:asparagine synthase (glutamine-hydrolysing)
MCGIAGLFHYSPLRSPDRELLGRMTRVITHRGPDDEGIEVIGPCGLGNRRLSIIDLAGGHMPMANRDSSVWITYNGEIYNFRELRSRLEHQGHEFRTRSDTEVILHDYIERGPHAARDWNGMFGAAIFDSRANSLFLARDHFGIKPLYYYDDGHTIYFGSELKSILEDASVPRRLDRDALNLLLTLRYLPSPHTLLEGIHKLPPGHFLLADQNGVRVEDYYPDVPKLDETLREDDILERHLELLEQAVTRQMVSDVPIGLMLSGGVDSAALGHFMSKSGNERVRTFSVGFPGKGDWNELDDAQETASWIGSEHHPILIEKDDYTDFFPQSFWHLEEPVSEPTISAYYHVCKLAASHVKVVLMGQGADEPLAGYDRYFGERYHGLAAPVIRFTPAGWLIESLPRLEKLKLSVRSLAQKDALDRFLNIVTVFQPDWHKRLLKEVPLQSDSDLRRVARDVLRKYQGRVSGLPPLSQLLYIDARTMLSDDLLLFGDKIAMANSLEVRVPYLDLDLMRFIESVPAKYKIRGLTRKYFHKKALARVLPGNIMNRKKRGFATPMDLWFRTRISSQIRSVLLHPDAAVGDVFNQQTIAQMIDLHVAGKENFRKQIFLLMSYEFWAQRFLRNRTVGFADYET